MGPRTDLRLMRLLFVSHSFPPADAPMSNLGGMQRVAIELHAALDAREDLSMRTLALRSSWKHVHFKAVPFLLSLALRLERETMKHRAEAVLFTSMTSALPLLIAGGRLKKRGIVLAAIAHGLDVTDPNPIYQAAVGRLCRILDAAMPVSRATGEALVARGLRPDKVHVVSNAVDLNRFEGVVASRGRGGPVRIAAAPRLPDDAFLIVTVGRQVPRKGFAWFIEKVMPRLPERVIFWLAGDGPERRNIEAAIERGGLRGRVACLGRVSEADLVELYRRAQLFVMPNVAVPGDMEGFGIVMLEAGACGLPTLAADLEGIRDVIDEGVNGWLVPSEDPEAFAQRICGLLDDPSALRDAGDRAARYVTRSFAWSQTAERYLQILRKTHPH